jgi:hypothetical protein
MVLNKEESKLFLQYENQFKEIKFDISTWTDSIEGNARLIDKIKIK